jgi:magnesium transporter
MTTSVLFRDERASRIDDYSVKDSLGADSLLWVDLNDMSGDDVAAVAKAFHLEEETIARLQSPGAGPGLKDVGPYLQLTVASPVPTDAHDAIEIRQFHCLLGENWVVTAHEQAVPVLDDFAERTQGSGATGSLDGPGFVAILLEWVLGEYEAAFETIEEALEEFDIEAMKGRVDASKDRIATLVSLRRRIGILRRALVDHREPIVALSHPELEGLTSKDAARRFETLAGRLERTLDSVRDAREAVIASFDVLIARSGHRTNEIMKVLTLATVILLPGSLVAGLMGMNFKVTFFDNSAGFWVVTGAIVVFGIAVAILARKRRWIGSVTD